VSGYGPVGRATVDALELSGVEVTIIELNPETCQKQKKLGKSIVHGSTVDPEVLELAGIHQADALVITTPDEEAAVRSCEVARRLAPKIFIAVRTKHISMAMQATQAGADHVIAEEIATALKTLGFPKTE